MKKYLKPFLTIMLIFLLLILSNIHQQKNNIIEKSYIDNYKFKITAIPPLSGHITSFFGYRVNPITYKLDFHPAIDICAPNQSYIYSILPGQVKETGNSHVDGNYIIISHQYNIESKYCHCEKILQNIGNFIKQGQIISTVGHTGFATGDHLHLEIKINDINIDPLLLITIS